MFGKYRRALKLKKKYPTCSIANNVKIIGNLENLVLGENVEIQDNVILHLGGYDWCDNLGSIEIGDNSIISYNCILFGAGPGGIRIGKNFKCGPGVKIFSSYEDFSDNYRHKFKEVLIKDNVMLCTNSVIHYGVIIGEGSLIGANSLVLGNVSDRTFVAGSPAKKIRDL